MSRDELISSASTRASASSIGIRSTPSGATFSRTIFRAWSALIMTKERIRGFRSRLNRAPLYLRTLRSALLDCSADRRHSSVVVVVVRVVDVTGAAGTTVVLYGGPAVT